jgi:hypothetical protein
VSVQKSEWLQADEQGRTVELASVAIGSKCLTPYLPEPLTLVRVFGEDAKFRVLERANGDEIVLSQSANVLVVE